MGLVIALLLLALLLGGVGLAVEALRWVLLTHEPARTFRDAWRVVERYEQRPLIEEYHKCLKTGCRVEHRAYQYADRLEAVIGLLSIVAVRLLHLKTISRHEPERPAKGVASRRATNSG
jgi:hypothetical protein